MHAFGKITLFFCAGAIMVASHKTEISQMKGLAEDANHLRLFPHWGPIDHWAAASRRRMEQWYLSLGAAETGQLVFIAVFMISSLLNIAHLVPIVINGFFFAPPEEAHDDHHPDYHSHVDHGPGDATGQTSGGSGAEEAP